MNCDSLRADITLYLYDELPDDERYELERHLEACAGCTAELTAAREFKSALSVFPVAEPGANLLAASRLRLQEALETCEPDRGWRRWILEPAYWLRQIKLAPAAAALLFLAGFGAGASAAYRLAGISVSGTPVEVVSPPAPAPEEASVLGIRDISQRPGSRQVDIKYDTVIPQTVSGAPDDPRIQTLLLFAARNNANSGVRGDSVDLLARQPGDERVRQALTYALQYDANPGVRLRALQALGSLVKGDLQARDAVLAALLNDRNPGIRTEAIDLLRPVRADASVRQVLGQLAERDRDPPIRRLSRSVLISVPPME
jgi:hypothetical protein